MLDEILIEEKKLANLRAENELPPTALPGSEERDIPWQNYQLFELNLVPDISEAQNQYNRYYWFVRFVSVVAKEEGEDVSLEQMAFQMLERADDWEGDFEILGKLDKAARDV